jgi:chemotaxis protein methyltransferase CheR
VEALADDRQLLKLCRKIERDRGFFCSSYKDTCLRRRISVRMRVKGASSFEQYCEILDSDPLEYERLIATLTINVSKFFRNPDIYASIAANVLPELGRSAAPLVRIWSAGCASGEEAYSLAVLCDQHARAEGTASTRFEIIGTDVDADAVTSARRGRYPDAAFAETIPAVRDMYFPISDGLRSPSPEIRRLVSFQRADLLDTAKAATRVSLIVCRNVIIYFTRPAQEQLFQHFHEVLLPGGFLVLGKVETLLGKSRGMFESVSPRSGFFAECNREHNGTKVVPEKTKRVLVVDDSAFMRRLIAEVVELRDDFRVVGTASDGFEALDSIREFSPDIVTLDVAMPGSTAWRRSSESWRRCRGR